MASIFLCHSSVDKPFVEKLAKDLKHLGVNVWFDKWEIKVGESLTERVQEGIRQNEFLAIVLSPDAVGSESGPAHIKSFPARGLRGAGRPSRLIFAGSGCWADTFHLGA